MRNKQKANATCRRCHHNDKMAALDHYGRSCPCGMDDERALTIDHVYNDGKQECLRILDWFPGLVDRNAAPAQEVLIPWEDVRAFTAQTKTEPA